MVLKNERMVSENGLCGQLWGSDLHRGSRQYSVAYRLEAALPTWYNSESINSTTLLKFIDNHSLEIHNAKDRLWKVLKVSSNECHANRTSILVKGYSLKCTLYVISLHLMSKSSEASAYERCCVELNIYWLGLWIWISGSLCVEWLMC